MLNGCVSAVIVLSAEQLTADELGKLQITAVIRYLTPRWFILIMFSISYTMGAMIMKFEKGLVGGITYEHKMPEGAVETKLS
jgi:hypothetical protein